MERKLSVTNLSDSVPFYNLLFDGRPFHLEHDRVGYKISKWGSLWLLESSRINPVVNSIVEEDQEAFFALYQRIKKYLNKGSMYSCELLGDSIQVSDPSGNLWVISTEFIRLEEWNTSRGSKCYLEPFRN